MEFTHAQYILSKNEILSDTGFAEDYQDIEGETDRLVWLADFDNGFNADINYLDAAIKTSVPINSISGNLTSGILAAGTAVDNADGYNAWANPTNVYTVNGSYADAHLDSAERQTNYLKCTNFGFSIPTGATVTDVYARATGYFADGGNASLSGKIVKAGVIGGNQVGSGVLTSITPTNNTAETICGTAADDGGAGPAWSNASNVTVDDSNYASVTRSTYVYSNLINCTNFGFSVPAGNIVTHVNVHINSQTAIEYEGFLIGITPSYSAVGVPVFGATYRYTFDFNINRDLGASDVNATGFGVGIRVKNTSPLGENRIYYVKMTVTYAPYTSFPTVAIPVGGGLWGNTLTPSDVNASTFGVALQVTNVSGDNQMYIDQVSMEVKYHEDAANEFTTTIKINPQNLGWETLTSFTDTYTVGAGATTKTHQQAFIRAAAALTNAKAPFKIGMFLTVPGILQYKEVTMDGSHMLIQGDSE